MSKGIQSTPDGARNKIGQQVQKFSYVGSVKTEDRKYDTDHLKVYRNKEFNFSEDNG